MGGTATAGEQAATRIVAVNGERHQQRQEAQHDAGSERVEPAMDRLPALVQARLIQTFENAHRIGMVGRPDDKFTPDAVLSTEIRDFEIEAGGNPVAVVTIAARVVSQRTGRISAASLFTARVPAAGTSGQWCIRDLHEGRGRGSSLSATLIHCYRVVRIISYR